MFILDNGPYFHIGKHLGGDDGDHTHICWLTLEKDQNIGLFDRELLKCFNY